MGLGSRVGVHVSRELFEPFDVLCYSYIQWQALEPYGYDL